MKLIKGHSRKLFFLNGSEIIFADTTVNERFQGLELDFIIYEDNMKADLINELARLRDELRNVSTKIDNAIENATEEANKPKTTFSTGPATPVSFVVLTEAEEDFLRNWFDSPGKPSFSDWERSFLDSVLQRNMSYPTIKLTQKQYDSFIKIFAKHEASK